MLKTIAEVSPELLKFIASLKLSVSSPQKRHIAQVADWLIDLSRSMPGKPVFSKATVYVLLRMTIGPFSFTKKAKEAPSCGRG